MTQAAPAGYERATLNSWPMADEICLPLIRLWCEVLEDANPAYYDAQAAEGLLGGIIAPPTMVMPWCARPEWTPGGSRWSRTQTLQDKLADLPHVVGLRSVQTHSRPLRIGERLAVNQFINPPSEPKQTHRGPGRQVDIHHSLRDPSGAEIVSWVNQTLRFAAPKDVDPDAGLPQPSPDLAGAATRAPAQPVAAGEIRAGQLLPPIQLPLTLKRFIKWVAATRDYFESHHDRDYARATGARDMYIGVHFFHGLVGRLITDWAGPRALLQRMDVISWGRAFPGETARAAGRVAGVDRDRASIDLAIECSCERGKLYDVAATVRLVKAPLR